MVLIVVIFGITLRTMILSFFSVIIRNDLSIKSVKSFLSTFQLHCQLTFIPLLINEAS